jgi:hypothetical protein
MPVQLPVHTLPRGSRLFRCHHWPTGGQPDPALILQGGKNARWRFDAPLGSYDVVYLALHPFGAWAETMRAPGGAVAGALCAARRAT